MCHGVYDPKVSSLRGDGATRRPTPSRRRRRARGMSWAARVALVGASVVTLFLFTRMLEPREDVSFYALEGGEVVALKSLQNGKYLEVHHRDGKVYATASDSHAYAAQWRVLVLDAATVEVLAKSAQAVDYHSQRFTGRKMSSGSGCACSGFSNDHGFGRFCHPWETDDQEPWCYVNSSCPSTSARGSFGTNPSPNPNPSPIPSPNPNPNPRPAHAHRERERAHLRRRQRGPRHRVELQGER